MRDEVVECVEGGVVALAVEVAFAVLKDHDGGGFFGVVLGGDVDPVVADHAVVDLAAQGEFFRECAGGHAGMLEGIAG